MRTHHNVRLTTDDVEQAELLLGRFLRASQQGHAHGGAGQQLRQRARMLRCQHLGRRDEGALKTSLHHLHHRQQRHHSLAAAHVSLQHQLRRVRTVKGLADAFQRVGLPLAQGVRQGFFYLRRHTRVLRSHRHRRPLLRIRATQRHHHLQLKRFVEFDAALRGERPLYRRLVDLPHGLGKGNQRLTLWVDRPGRSRRVCGRSRQDLGGLVHSRENLVHHADQLGGGRAGTARVARQPRLAQQLLGLLARTRHVHDRFERPERAELSTFPGMHGDVAGVFQLPRLTEAPQLSVEQHDGSGGQARLMQTRIAKQCRFHHRRAVGKREGDDGARAATGTVFPLRDVDDLCHASVHLPLFQQVESLGTARANVLGGEIQQCVRHDAQLGPIRQLAGPIRSDDLRERPLIFPPEHLFHSDLHHVPHGISSHALRWVIVEFNIWMLPLHMRPQLLHLVLADFRRGPQQGNQLAALSQQLVQVGDHRIPSGHAEPLCRNSVDHIFHIIVMIIGRIMHGQSRQPTH